MNYPQDRNTDNNDFQFMWGTDLIISPILDEGKNELNAYFPAGIWYHQSNLTVVRNGTTGGYVNLPLSVTEIGLAFRGGSVIATQDPQQTTTAQRDTPFNLIVLLDNEGKAIGHLYWDDGESLDNMDFGEFNFIYFEARNGSLTSSSIMAGYAGETARIKKISIAGDWSRYAATPTVTFKSKKTEQRFTTASLVNNVLSVEEEEGIVMTFFADFQISWSS